MNTRILLALAATFTMTNLTPGADAPDTSFLKLYAETRGFMLGRPTKPKISPDGKTVLFLRSEAKTPKNKLFEFDVATGKTRELLSPEMLLKGADENLTPEEKARRERQRVSVGGFADYHLNPAGTHILVKLANSLFVFDRAANKAVELKTDKDGAIVDPKWSPDGKLIGYVRGWDVYAYDLAAEKESAITTGGTQVKTHGLAEFVAQEEMGRHSGFWWSPDSKSIAYEEADHTGVEQWFVADPLKPEVPPAPQYYPRPGKKNVSVRLGVKKLSGGDTVWVDWDRKEYEYLAAVHWEPEGPLAIQLQDRKQQHLSLLKVDAKTGQTKTLVEDKTSTWVNLNPESPPHFLKGLDGFLWLGMGKYSPLVQLRDSNTGKIKSIPVGCSEIHSTYTNSDGTFIIYAIYPNTGLRSIRRHKMGEFTMDPDWKKDELLSPNNGYSTGSFGKGGGPYTITSTSFKAMPRTTVYSAAGVKVADLPSVALEPLNLPNVSPVVAGDGFDPFVDSGAVVVRPRVFDSKKKYPVIVDVYGGPKHQHVVQAMRNWLVPQWLADQGFIVVAIDNRGTPDRGRQWEEQIYQKFGTIPLVDQTAGLRALFKDFPEMDRDRVGIFGWSFGGYMSANAVLRRPDVFKAAVAGAPVTDWEDYDTHYTERYMGLLPESKAAYDEASLIPLAKNLKRPLLLVHGTADDNVYYRHSLKLSDALFRAGRDFESLALPGITHMYSSDPVIMERLFAKTATFFKTHLGEVK